MANLETLELTINGSATSASEGIDKLIASLSSLSQAIIKPYSDLVDFNAELKKTRDLCKGIHMPNLGKMTGAKGASAKAKAKTQNSNETWDGNRGYVVPKPTPESIKRDNDWWVEFRKRATLDYVQRKEYHEWAIQRRKELAEQANKAKEEIRPLAQNSVAVKNLADNMYHYSKATGDATKKTNALSKITDFFKQGIGSVKSGVGKLTSGFTGMFGRIKRIATTMLIRKAIRSLIKAIGEGITNLYQWSKLNKGEFANSLDSLKAKTTQLKNSLGAAIAPVIQAAIPVVRALANALIDALNWANQLIALLSGKSTWTKATEGAEAFIEDTNNATGAAKEWLAAWDELNVMSSDGGGGGGKTQTDFSNMFEEMSDFEEHIRQLAEFFKKNAEDIRDVAIEAGAAFLAWKVSEAFSGTLGTIASIAAAGIIMDITWKMTAMFDKEYLDTGEEGWLVADAITSAVGSTLAGTVIGSVLGTGAGIITAGLTLIVSGAISYGIAMSDPDNDNAEALKTIGLVKGLIGDLFIGAGFAVATGSLTAGAVAAAVAAPLFFVVASVVTEIVSAKNAQEIANEAFLNAGEGGLAVDEIFNSLQRKFDEYASPYKVSIKLFANKQQALADIEKVKTQLSSLNSVILSDQTLTLEQAEEFKQAWETVFSSFELANRDDWDTIFEGFNAAITTQDESLKEMAKNARIRALEINNGLSELEAQLVDRMNELVDKIIQGTATNEELEEYKQKMEAFGVIADETISSFKKLVQGATTIDFGDAESGIAAAVEFIHNVTESYHETVASIDEGLEAQLAAIESQKSRIKDYLKAGLITQEQANEWIGELDSWAEIFTEAAEEKKDSLAQDIQDAFGLVLNTAKEGLKQYLDENGSIDFEGAATYVDSVIRPIIQAISDSDADVTEAIASVFTFGEELKDYIDFEDLNELMNLIMGEIGQAALEAGKTIDLGNEMIQSIFNLANWDINDANKNEIALRLAEAFNFDAAVASLKDYFELDVSSMIKIYGWKDLETAQQEALINALIKSYGSSETIAAIKKAVPDISIDEILNIVHYEEFDKKQSKEFVKVIKDIFGDDAAKQAAEEVGYDIGEEVGKGMANNTDVKKQAKKWNTDISNEIDKPHTVSVTANTATLQTTGKSVYNTIDTETKKNHSTFVTFAKDTVQKMGTDMFNVLDAKTKIAHNTNIGYNATTVQAKGTEIFNTIDAKTKVAHNINAGYTPKTMQDKGTAVYNEIDAKTKLSHAVNVGYVQKTLQSKGSAAYNEIDSKTKLSHAINVGYTAKTIQTKGSEIYNTINAKTSVSHGTNVGYNKTTLSTIGTTIFTLIDNQTKQTHTINTGYNKASVQSVGSGINTIISGYTKNPFMISTSYSSAGVRSTGSGISKNIKDYIGSDFMIGTDYSTAGARYTGSQIKKNINDYIGKDFSIGTTFSEAGVRYTGSQIRKNIKDYTGSSFGITVATNSDNLKGVTKDIKDAATVTGTAKANTNKDNLKGVTKDVKDAATVEGTVKVSASSDSIKKFKETIHNALSGVIKLKSGDDEVGKVSYVAAASGGLFDAGQVFIAREAGPELVGKFGNQTGVANQREIISGIQRGVYDANQEQNALLRRQNELLYGILQKSSNVTIGASAALGRVVNQSMNMYNGLVGG